MERAENSAGAMEMVLIVNRGSTFFQVIMSDDNSVPCESTTRVFMGSKKEKELKLSGENKPRFFLIKPY
jgi:hypothetical protein